MLKLKKDCAERHQKVNFYIPALCQGHFHLCIFLRAPSQQHRVTSQPFITALPLLGGSAHADMVHSPSAPSDKRHGADSSPCSTAAAWEHAIDLQKLEPYLKIPLIKCWRRCLERRSDKYSAIKCFPRNWGKKCSIKKVPKLLTAIALAEQCLGCVGDSAQNFLQGFFGYWELLVKVLLAYKFFLAYKTPKVPFFQIAAYKMGHLIQ